MPPSKSSAVEGPIAQVLIDAAKDAELPRGRVTWPWRVHGGPRLGWVANGSRSTRSVRWRSCGLASRRPGIWPRTGFHRVGHTADSVVLRMAMRVRRGSGAPQSRRNAPTFFAGVFVKWPSRDASSPDSRSPRTCARARLPPDHGCRPVQDTIAALRRTTARACVDEPMKRSVLRVDDARTATRGFRKCDPWLSVQATVDAPLQPPVAAGGRRPDALRAALTARFGAGGERLAGELVRGDLG